MNNVDNTGKQKYVTAACCLPSSIECWQQVQRKAAPWRAQCFGTEHTTTLQIKMVCLKSTHRHLQVSRH